MDFYLDDDALNAVAGGKSSKSTITEVYVTYTYDHSGHWKV